MLFKARKNLVKFFPPLLLLISVTVYFMLLWLQLASKYSSTIPFSDQWDASNKFLETNNFWSLFSYQGGIPRFGLAFVISRFIAISTHFSNQAQSYFALLLIF